MPWCPPCKPPYDLIQPVTANHTLNFLSVGLPGILCPEEVNPVAFGREAPPVALANANNRKLTYRCDPTWDFYVDYITCQLFSVADGAIRPVLVNNLAGIQADVRFRMYDGASRHVWQTEAIHWQSLAGNGRNPIKLFTPLLLNAGNSYEVEVFNNDPTTDFLIGLYFHGRRVKARSSRDGNVIASDNNLERILRAGQVRQGTNKRARYLTGDNFCNKRDLGVTHYKAIPNGPTLLAAGTLAAPSTTTITYNVDARSNFYVRNIFGWQRGDGDDTVDALIDEPVSLRIYDERSEYFLSNRPIPMNAIVGDGRFPYTLPQDWVWPQGADITVDWFNFSTAAVEVQLVFEGWNRDSGVC